MVLILEITNSSDNNLGGLAVKFQKNAFALAPVNINIDIGGPLVKSLNVIFLTNLFPLINRSPLAKQNAAV